MNSFWKNRTALVTGASGFVGAHIVKRLLEKGAKVFCLLRNPEQNNSLNIMGLQTKVVIIKGSIEDFVLIEKILNENKIDAVFHLAAQSLVGVGTRSPVPTFEINIRGTYLLLEACRHCSTVQRIVIASSEKVYRTQIIPPFTEESPLQGLYPYDVSKTCTDLIAQSFANSYQLPVTVTRSTNIYGGGDLNFSRIIPGTIHSILQNQSPVIRSDGLPIREFIHVEDVGRGYLELAENIEKSSGKAYNLGTGEPIKMINLVTKILGLMGKENELPPDILLCPKPGQSIDAQFLSSEKIFHEFGWKAEISLDIGLKETINWYRQHFAQIV
jgi:CDP-glucose 4,6-dehydratase